jgi:arylsulfatase A-like enzyme
MMDKHKQARRVLLFVVDQWRGDTLSVLGHPQVSTPHLDKLISDGVTFRRHYSTTSPCGPARASLLTGLYAMNHRVVRNGTPLDARHTNLALEARKAGYKPAIFGYTSSTPDPRGLSPYDPALKDQHGNMPGWEEVAPGLPISPTYMAYAKSQGYDIPPDPRDFWLPVANHPGAGSHGPTWPPARFKSEHSDNAFLIDEAIKYLRVRENQPWFIHIAPMRPHPPFVAPEPYHDMFAADEAPSPIRAASQEAERKQHPLTAFLLDTTPQLEYMRNGKGLAVDLNERDIRQLRATYHGMISELDHHLGRLIAYLKESGQYQDTLIVFTGDHGEQLGDHYLLGKEGYFEASYHVPLVICAPDTDANGSRGTIVGEFTESIDVMPTILDWLGAEIPGPCDGESLLPYCFGSKPQHVREEVHHEFDFRDVIAEQSQRAMGLRMEQCNFSAVRDLKFKYVHFPTLPPLLFDLERDPQELSNLAADPDYETVVRRYAQKLLSWRQEHHDRTLTIMQASPDGLVTRHESRR